MYIIWDVCRGSGAVEGVAAIVLEAIYMIISTYTPGGAPVGVCLTE